MKMDELKCQKIGGISYQYSASWIHSLESEMHWRLYWRQQKIMQDLIKPGHRVLEIGVGSGFTANYLRSKEISVTTLDIDADKNPDIVANIVSYEFPDSYDHILAFEVFEHIPFDIFKVVLKKISRRLQGCMFLSVPRNERLWFRAEITMPKIREKIFELVTLKRRITTPAHFWEIDDGKIDGRDFKDALTSSSFKILRFDKSFSREFFALAKRD